MKAFTFLHTHYAPLMLSCILSSERRKQDDLSFVCHSVMLWLVMSYQEGEDDVALTLLLLSPDAAETDPHSQGAVRTETKCHSTTDRNNETWQRQKLMMRL